MENDKKWCLLNFVVGQAKMAVYRSRKNQVEGEAGLGLAEMFGVQARVRVDFRYHSLMGTMEEFRDLWCFTSAVCTVQEGKLLFN